MFAYENEPLEGVVFYIIADGNIVSQDGSGKVVYKNGAVVATVTTDENGHAWADGLPIGNYILREGDAPEGFMRVGDERFSITAIEQTKQFTFLAYDLTDKRQKLGIEIIKTDNGSGKLLAGATFTLYAAEEIRFGSLADGDVGFLTAFLNALGDALFGKKFNVIEKDAAIATAVTGNDGKAVFADLPPGKYYIKETKAPSGYRINTTFMPEFELTYDRGGTEVLVWKATCKNAKNPAPSTPTPAPTQPTKPPGSVPKTGDGFDAALWIWIMIAAGAAAAISIALICERRKKGKTSEGKTGKTQAGRGNRAKGNK